MRYFALIALALPFTAFAAQWSSIGSRQTEIVEAPSSFGAGTSDPREILDTSLRLAAREGRLKEMRRLIGAGADPNGTGSFGESALQYAARYNRIDAAELLLKHGADPDLRDSSWTTALMKAATTRA